MDQSKLITETLRKYEDNHAVKSDILRIVRLIESEINHFLDQFLKNRPRPEHANDTKRLNSIVDNF